MREQPLRCMNCFKRADRIPGKTICLECCEQLFPQNLKDVVIPLRSKMDEREIEKAIEQENKEVLILLENAHFGMRLEDFPLRLIDAVNYLYCRSKIRKPKGHGGRYFLPALAPQVQKEKVSA